MESYLELGERLKEIRGNMGLSLEQVSALTGVSKTMLSQIESSKSIPTIATVFKIANGLKIKVDSLLCGEKKQYYDVININNLSPAIDNHEQVYMYCIFPFSPTTGFEKSGEAIKFDATWHHKYINKGETDVIAQVILSY